MDLHAIALLSGVGVLAGMMASIVGGAAVLVYPALIASGLSPQLAAASNLVAPMPATMLAALSDRSQLPAFNRAFVELVFASATEVKATAKFDISLEKYEIERPSLMLMKINDVCQVALDLVLKRQ